MIKRLFDILVSGILLILLSPLFLVISILVIIDGRGPIFFRALRAGKNGSPFYLLKFRSMIVGADQQGPGITRKGDSRITKVGDWLRRTKLDELPQLLNVLRGEMSLVGPRPEDPRYIERYTAEQKKVLDILPGITGLASIAYRHEEDYLNDQDWETKYFNVIMPAKLVIDLEYAQTRSFWLDVKILWLTLLSIFR